MCFKFFKRRLKFARKLAKDFALKNSVNSKVNKISCKIFSGGWHVAYLVENFTAVQNMYHTPVKNRYLYPKIALESVSFDRLLYKWVSTQCGQPGVVAGMKNHARDVTAVNLAPEWSPLYRLLRDISEKPSRGFYKKSIKLGNPLLGNPLMGYHMDG